jgi:hypothetical protein
MPETPANLPTSFELVLPGELGPMLTSTFTALGAAGARAASDLLLSVRPGQSLPDVVAMLQDRGFEVLAIRRVRPPAQRAT